MNKAIFNNRLYAEMGDINKQQGIILDFIKEIKGVSITEPLNFYRDPLKTYFLVLFSGLLFSPASPTQKIL
jgi:hypothetical protein